MENNKKHLNTFINTLKPGEVTVVVAPFAHFGVSETNFIRNVALQCGIIEGKSTAYFPRTSSAFDVMWSITCALAELDYRKVANGDLDDVEWLKLRDTVRKLRACNRNLFIGERFTFSLSEVYAKCRELKEKNGLDFIILERLFLNMVDNPRAQDVSEVLRTLRTLQNIATELQVSLLITLPCNRAENLVCEQYLPLDNYSIVEAHSSHSRSLEQLRSSCGTWRACAHVPSS